MTTEGRLADWIQVGATKNVAWRFKNDKIRCNAICPGGDLTQQIPMPDYLLSCVGVKTNIGQSRIGDLDMDAVEVMKPIHTAHVNDSPGFNQPASAESIANLLLFMTSDMSMEISGAIIPIDHAWSTI